MRLHRLISSIVLLLFLSVVWTVQAQDAYVKLTASKTINLEEIPKSLVRKFKRDAARLALRLEAGQEDLRYKNIVISRANVDVIYTILSTIYKKDAQAQAIAKCNIHTFPNPSIDHIKVIFDKTIRWASPLQDGITETTSPAINQLLEDYDLIIERHEKWTNTEDIIVIRSKEPLNMAALANEFYMVEGVVEIDLGIPELNGNDIALQRQADHWLVSYILTYGNSFIKSSVKKHTWTYQVFDDGTFNFVEAEGDPLPDYIKCNPNAARNGK